MPPILRIAAACLALAACSRDGAAPPPDLDVRRLADEAVPAGQPAHREQVGGVTRKALPGTHLGAIVPRPVPRPRADGAEGVEVAFACPAQLAGRDAVVVVGSHAGAADGMEPLVERIRCPPSPADPVEVRLPEYPGIDDAIWIVRGFVVERVESKPVRLEPGARLRVALGLVPGREMSALAPARFLVTALDAQGATAPVLDRRLDPGTRPPEAGWVQDEVGLDPVRRALGPEVRLVFEVRADDTGAPLTFPVWGDPTVTWPRTGEARPPRRNVVLVSLDTLRADRLGIYGARRATSPTLDALAAESTLFETVIAPAPWTLPSHTAMMTGLHECVHGMTGTVGRPFPPGLVPLASRLRDAGYATAAVTEDGFVDAAAFLRGFGYYWENRDGDDRVRGTVSQAETWLRDEATEPFFLFVHTYQTHDPYFSPEPYATMFAETDGLTGRVPVARASAAEQALARYDRAIRYTDAAIAPLLDAIRARPRGDRTLIVVTSDHGEAFGEHGYTGHGKTLHEEVLRVPLLVWAPGLVAAGRRVPGLAGVIDVTPTVLELLGMPVPPDITGMSLAPQLRAGGEPPPLPERVLWSQNTLHDTDRLSARSPRWKAMWQDRSLQIFDLDRDPTERLGGATQDLAAQAAEARARFEQECRRQKAAMEEAGAARAVEAVPLPDAGRQRQLKALGYLD